MGRDGGHRGRDENTVCPGGVIRVRDHEGFVRCTVNPRFLQVQFCNTFVVTVPVYNKINAVNAADRLHTIQFLQLVMCQKEPVTVAALWLSLLAKCACKANKTKTVACS